MSRRKKLIDVEYKLLYIQKGITSYDIKVIFYGDKRW